MATENALVLMDCINEIMHSDGKLADKGYADFIQRHATAGTISDLLSKARVASWLVCHIHIGLDAAMLHKEGSCMNHPYPPEFRRRPRSRPCRGH